MSSKKNRKKSGEKTPKAAVSVKKPAAYDGLNESSKEFYIAQIRDLEAQLEKYQHRCDELEIREKDFSTNYNNAEREKKDIVQYLKRFLAQKDDELTDLSEKLMALQLAKDAEKESFEMQLSTLRHEFQENKDKLISENMALAGKLASVEEFLVQKEELMTLLTSLKEQMKRQKEEHQAIIYNLEKKAVLDNERLKKEMLQRVATAAAEFWEVTERSMPETTKRAIHENASLTAQLRDLSYNNEELYKENNALTLQKKELMTENEITESLMEEMTKKSVANQKVVKQLTEKCKQMKTELENFARHKQVHQQLLEDHSALQKKHDNLREEQESIMDKLNQKQAEAEHLKKELQEVNMQREQLETVLQEAAVALKEALTEVPKEEDSEVLVLVRRNQMMQKLLSVLNSAAAIGKGPALSEFVLTTRPSMQRTSPLPPLKKTSHLSHYKPGDLGLVPRPSNTHMSDRTSLQKLQRKQQLQNNH
ncbi:cilia- and flagella-associated protein 157-like [Hoplias malabaricus]|uniref:cilia- and flagella-associated protein 157-like n=1 Tax=Hoplias malabaricus TaxID=27720 RepID=UPI003462BEBE